MVLQEQEPVMTLEEKNFPRTDGSTGGQKYVNKDEVCTLNRFHAGRVKYFIDEWKQIDV